MARQSTAWDLPEAVLAERRQLRDGLLDGEVARAQSLADLAAAVRAGGGLILEARVGEQV